MSTFDEDVAILTRQRTAPADHAKRSLAPQRAEILAFLKTLLTWIASNKSTLEASQQKFLKAAALGLLHTNMAAHLQEVFGTQFAPGLLVTAPASCDVAVAQMDALSNFDVQCGMPVRLADSPRKLRPLLGLLKELAAAIAKEDKELDEILANAAASAEPRLEALPIPERRPAPRGLVVETEFQV